MRTSPPRDAILAGYLATRTLGLFACACAASHSSAPRHERTLCSFSWIRLFVLLVMGCLEQNALSFEPCGQVSEGEHLCHQAWSQLESVSTSIVTPSSHQRAARFVWAISPLAPVGSSRHGFDVWPSKISYLIVSVLPGTNISTSEEVAIKLESVKSKHPQLLYESKVLKILQVCAKPFLPVAARMFWTLSSPCLGLHKFSASCSLAMYD
jgi:hypothetical protein